MTRTRAAILFAGALFAASCATAPPTAVTPRGDDRFLIDPRTGYGEQLPPALVRKFDAAWRFVISGNDAEARRRITEIRKAKPDYLPAALAETVLTIRAGRFADAAKAVKALREKSPENMAAQVYEAEIAAREKRTRAAFDLYRPIAAAKGAPAIVAERLAQLRTALFNDLVGAAKTAEHAESLRLLREALEVNPDGFEARILLASTLLEDRDFDGAMKELEPLLDASADRSEVQEILAEIDVGRGRYEEAIVRYERLARRTTNDRYLVRLEDIKREWSAANMPRYYRKALESTALTREQLAVLLFWSVPSVRFAQNLGTPPIALDIADVEGRDEIIRAIATGILDVDPVTREVSPARPVTAERLTRHLARVLARRGAVCAKGIPTEKILAACGVENPVAGKANEDLVTGSEAARGLEQVAKALQ